MKTTLALIGAVIATCTFSQSPTNGGFDRLLIYSNSVPSLEMRAHAIVEQAKREGFATNLVNEILRQGLVCEARGHNWKSGRVGEDNGKTFLDYHPNTEYRHCVNCGKSQSQNYEWHGTEPPTKH